MIKTTSLYLLSDKFYMKRVWFDLKRTALYLKRAMCFEPLLKCMSTRVFITMTTIDNSHPPMQIEGDPHGR